MEVRNSRLLTPFVTQLLYFFPIEERCVWIFPGKPSRPFAYPVKSSLDFVRASAVDIWHQPRNRPSVSSDDDFLAALNAVQERSQSVLGLESADFRFVH